MAWSPPSTDTSLIFKGGALIGYCGEFQYCPSPKSGSLILIHVINNMYRYQHQSVWTEFYEKEEMRYIIWKKMQASVKRQRKLFKSQNLICFLCINVYVYWVSLIKLDTKEQIRLKTVTGTLIVYILVWHIQNSSNVFIVRPLKQNIQDKKIHVFVSLRKN